MDTLPGTLEQMWQLQLKQQMVCGLDPEGMPEHRKLAVAKDLVLNLQEEVSDLAREATRYKVHLIRSQPIDRGNFSDAVADVIKLTFAIAQLHGMEAKDVFDAFVHKTLVVNDKVRGDRLKLERETKLVVTDLDMCVADMSTFQNKLSDAQGERPTDDQMTAELERLKDTFYREGGFQHLPTIPGAREALVKIRALGYKLIIITARPHWQYKRIYADTVGWLKSNGIPYDQILFNKDKAEALYEFISPARPVLFVEDRAKHCLELVGIGIKVALMDYPWNQSLPNHPLINRVSSWDNVVKILETP